MRINFMFRSFGFRYCLDTVMRQILNSNIESRHGGTKQYQSTKPQCPKRDILNFGNLDFEFV